MPHEANEILSWLMIWVGVAFLMGMIYLVGTIKDRK